MPIFNSVYKSIDYPMPRSGLLAYYPFESDFNDHKADLGVSGTTHNATMRNSFSYSFDAGKAGNCVNKTSSGDASMESGIMLGTTFTVMFWLYMTSNDYWNIYGGNKVDDGAYGFNIQFQSNKPGIKVYGSHYYADNSISTNAWHHIAITQNGTTVVLYVDKVGKTFTVDGNAGQNNFNFLGQGWPNTTNCKMDEMYIYNRAITSQEVSKYYNATN